MMPIATQIKNNNKVIQIAVESQEENYANHFNKSPCFQIESLYIRLGELPEVANMLWHSTGLKLTYQDIGGKVHF